MDKLLEILKNLRPDVAFETQTAIIDDGLLDSFDIIALVAEVEATFGVSIGLEDLEPVNFNSVSAMEALLTRLGATL